MLWQSNWFRGAAIILAFILGPLTEYVSAQDATPLPTASDEVKVEYLVSTSSVAMPAAEAEIIMVRLNYPPHAVFKGKSSGVVVYYIEKGALAIPDALTTAKIIDYSGPESNPPPRRVTEAGESIFPAGYGIVFENGPPAETRNPDDEPAVVLVMALAPFDDSQYESASPEETAVP